MFFRALSCYSFQVLNKKLFFFAFFLASKVASKSQEKLAFCFAGFPLLSGLETCAKNKLSIKINNFC
jgi:hypothetical protein